MNLKEEIITFPMGINLVFVFFFLFLSNISNEDRMVTEKNSYE